MHICFTFCEQSPDGTMATYADNKGARSNLWLVKFKYFTRTYANNMQVGRNEHNIKKHLNQCNNTMQ